MAGQVELGCGLIAIGRPWGTTPEVPAESEALQFLEVAYEAGIRHFDTAPSYGLSEVRLGQFLRSLPSSARSGVTISTKCGEKWDAATGAGSVDHSKESLCASISRSIDLLGTVSILQIHKASEEVLGSDGMAAAIEFAREQGIPYIGASASDVETAAMILKDDRFDYLQVPYNAASPQYREILERSRGYGVKVLTNRPFQMGDITAGSANNKQQAAVAAFKYILQADFDGVVLTGTSNPAHLTENITAFEAARA